MSPRKGNIRNYYFGWMWPALLSPSQTCSDLHGVLLVGPGGINKFKIVQNDNKFIHTLMCVINGGDAY